MIEIHTKPNAAILRCFNRQILRDYAKKLGVKRGRSKEDTIKNLLEVSNLRVSVNFDTWLDPRQST